MTNTDFIYACVAFASLSFAGFALFRCWKDAERNRVEKCVFSFFILLCPFLGAMIFFRAQEARGKVDRALRFRPGTGSGEDRTKDRPVKEPAKPVHFGQKSGLKPPFRGRK